MEEASAWLLVSTPRKDSEPMLSDVMTVSEVAEYLRVNPQTVYRKAKAGEMPVLRIGRAIRFRKSELEDWLKGLSGATLNEVKI